MSMFLIALIALALVVTVVIVRKAKAQAEVSLTKAVVKGSKVQAKAVALVALYKDGHIWFVMDGQNGVRHVSILKATLMHAKRARQVPTYKSDLDLAIERQNALRN